MRKSDAIEIILGHSECVPVVFTTGYASRFGSHIFDRPGNFYMTGSMGLAALIGIGVAECSGSQSIVVDGDGSILMNPGALVEGGRRKSGQIIHVILDDQAYESTGCQQTHSGHLCYAKLGIELGYAAAVVVRTRSELRVALSDALKCSSGSVLIHCAINSDRSFPPPRISISPEENSLRFSSYLVRAVRDEPGGAAS